MSDLVPVTRALLSVYDKTGLVELGQSLAARGVELVSTGGSARTLREAGLEVKDVSELTGFPEMMDGRVKTLHPKVHGGLLALRDDDGHVASMNEHGIGAIDLVVCNLYPFEATVQQDGVTFPEVIEQIDIGGPSMVRSAAKNHRFVAIVTDPSQYGALTEALDANDGATTAELRTDLARAAFARTAAYDSAISRWLAERAGESLPLTFASAKREAVLRYGENPHQEAAIYIDPMAPEGSLAAAKLLQGKAISFNNYNDVDAAWSLVREFDEPACVVIKHANPCGAAISNSIREAYERAVECDPRSAFGGIVALNEPLTVDLAMTMAVKERFFEVIIAPVVEPEVLAVFNSPDAPKWGKSLRILDANTPDTPAFGHDVRSIDGGFLVQTRDRQAFGEGCPKSVTKVEPTPQQARDLRFAWTVAKHTKSNAIVLAKDGQAVGVGAGQMSRVEATELAAGRARRFSEETGVSLEGMVASSDAFYPFNDGIEAALDVGAVALIQPGGSRNDPKAIELCDQRGVAMWFAGNRHFRH